MSANKIGHVGYKFRKRFDQGWFDGEVIEIREGAANKRDRRCVYEDGDMEDLSVAELEALARLDPKSQYRTKSISPKPSSSKSGNSDTAAYKDGDTRARKRSRSRSGINSKNLSVSSKGKSTTNVNVKCYQCNDDNEEDQKSATVRKSPRDREPPRTYNETLLSRKDQVRMIGYRKDRKKWFVRVGNRTRPGLKDGRKFIGNFDSYEEAEEALNAYKPGANISKTSARKKRRFDTLNDTKRMEEKYPRKKAIKATQITIENDLYELKASNDEMSEITLEKRNLENARTSDVASEIPVDELSSEQDITKSIVMSSSDTKKKKARTSNSHNIIPFHNKGQKSGNVKTDRAAASSQATKSCKIQTLLSSLEEDYVPVDKAAEGTIARCEDKFQSWDGINEELDSDEDEEKWLEKVASQLGARPPSSSRPMSRNGTILPNYEPIDTDMQQVTIPSRPISRNSTSPTDPKKTDSEVQSPATCAFTSNTHISSMFTLPQCFKPDERSSSALFAHQPDRPFSSNVNINAPQRLCVHIIEKKKGKKRSCQNRKLEGQDFCEDHCDPAFLSAPRFSVVHKTDDSGSFRDGYVSPLSSRGRKSLIGIEALKDALHTFFTTQIQNISNSLGTHIKSVEDALICDSDATPFPLGMKVRTFFDGHGFHDGRIIKVRRQYIMEGKGKSKEARPVLMYRVIYNDGDQQDYLHHNIASMRQVYDIKGIDSEANPEEQIPCGSLFELMSGITVKITGHTVQKKQYVSFVVDDDSNTSTMDVESTLWKFQVSVKRKLDLGLNAFRVNSRGGAVLEWPAISDRLVQPSILNNGAVRVCNGLHLLKKCHNAKYAIHAFQKAPYVDDSQDERTGVKMKRWDPANVYNYIHWDPSQCLVCELCGIDKDDNQVVICEECHMGFHSYCLRPVMVNIPSSDWVCRECSGVSNSISFSDYSRSISGQQESVLRFLNLPYTTYKDFIHENHEAISFAHSALGFNPNHHNSIDRNLFSVGSFVFVRSPDKHDFRLPIPSDNEEEYASTIESYVAAMKYCGMSRYSEENVYKGNVTKDMNNPALERDIISSLSKRNLSIFRAFKENQKRGVYPPIKIVNDERYGFFVEALKSIPRHTLIAEYTGEVITLSNNSESDSLMILLDSGDIKTSLIIDPTNEGNIARFLSGVNNKSIVSRRQANVRTRRFVLDGQMHVVMFTSRRIEPGEMLNYDYNAGRQGKSSEEWLKGGFYDTSNFF